MITKQPVLLNQTEVMQFKQFGIILFTRIPPMTIISADTSITADSHYTSGMNRKNWNTISTRNFRSVGGIRRRILRSNSKRMSVIDSTNVTRRTLFFFYDNKLDGLAQVDGNSYINKSQCQSRDLTITSNNNTITRRNPQIQLVMQGTFKGKQRILAGNIKVQGVPGLNR